MKYFKSIEIYILLYIFLKQIHARIYHITNYDNEIDFNNYVWNVNDEVIIYFDKDYYDFTKQYDINFQISTNVTIIGMGVNGTIFDFKDNKKGTFKIEFERENNYSITFKNLIFQNSNNLGEDKLSLFLITGNKLYNRVYFQDCIFRNNEIALIKLQRDMICSGNKFIIVSINNCQF